MIHLLFMVFIASLAFVLILLSKRVLKPFASELNSRTAIIVFFFGLIFVCFIWGFFSKQKISHAENRNLEKWKPLKETRIIDIPGQIDTYVNDHFGFRNMFIKFYRTVQTKLFNQSSTESVVIGKKDWLFSKNVINSTYLKEPISKSEINKSKIVEKIDLLQKKLLDQDILMFIIICPSKPYMYPEYLPDWIPIKEDNRKIIEHFKELITKNTNIPLLDLYPYLLEAKSQEEDILYYKNDTHWNSNGAYYAKLAIEQFFNKYEVTSKSISLKEYRKDYIEHKGDLSRMLSNESSENSLEYIFEERYPTNRIFLSDKCRKALGMNEKFSKWQNTKLDYGKNRTDSIIVPIIIADSYLLSSRFSCTELFNKYYSLHYAEMAEGFPFLIKKQNDIDVVILSFVDREYNAFVKSIMRWNPDKEIFYDGYGWEQKLPY